MLGLSVGWFVYNKVGVNGFGLDAGTTVDVIIVVIGEDRSVVLYSSVCIARSIIGV